MNASNIQLGNTVERLASDYTNGRRGRVIEIDNIKARARVHWTLARNGSKMNLRTWVRCADLRVVCDKIATASWKPETLEEIAGKAPHYKTARITACGTCVAIVGFSDGTFHVIHPAFGRESYGWRELDSFCL